jgi:hypothetical protein
MANYTTESKNIFLKGIEQNKNISPADKKVLMEVVSRQFQIMSQYVGTVELITLRTKQ